MPKPNSVGGSNDLSLIRTVTLVAAIILVIVGTIGNVLVVVTLWWNKKLRREHSTKFILSLAVSDLMFSMVVIPVSRIFVLIKNYTIANQLCEMQLILFFWTFFVSLASMTLISVNRLVLIVFNSKYHKVYTKLNVTLMIAFAWIFSLGMALIPYYRIWGKYELNEKKRNWCGLRPLNGTTPRPLFFIVGFAIPAVSMIITYGLIWYKVVHQGNILRTNRSAQRNFKLFKLIVVIFGAFLICYVPNLIIKGVIKQRGYGYVKAIGNILVWCNSCVNPIIYFSFNRDYRTALENMLGFRFCGSTPDQPTPSVDTTESALSSNGGRVNVPMSSTTSTTQH